MLAIAILATLLSATGASGATRTLSFGAGADTTIRSDRPTRSYGTTTKLTADNSPVIHTLLRFTVTGVGTDIVTGASLRLYVTNGSPFAGSAYRVGSQTWSENVSWNDAPVADLVPITNGATAPSSTWVAFNVLPLVGGDGTYSVRITSSASDGVGYMSREGTTVSLRPEIVVTTEPPADTTAPSVSVSAPSADAIVSDTVPVTATADDDVAVTSVDVAVDGSVIGIDPTAPYEVAWDTTLAANGGHTLTAVAHDAAGHATTSEPVAVTVANALDTSPPSTPGDLSATVDGPTQVTLAWTASADDVAVSSYEVQRDSVVIGAPTAPGFVDTFVSPGTTVTYTVTALDPTGNRSDPPATATAVTPSVPASFTFAAAGDHGANANTAGSLAALDASPASFYLALGDLDYDETPTDAAWCDYVHANLPTKGPAFPFEVLTGNHEEDPGTNGSILNHAACLPDQLGATAGPGSAYGAEYSFDYPAGAPLARFIMISPELTVGGTTYHYEPGTVHYAWLADTIDAARAAGIRWVIVGMHFPCLAAGQYSCAADPALLNLLVGRKVDLILHGHEHSYQRSKQLALDPTPCPSIPRNGYVPGCVVDDGFDNIYPKGAGSVDVIAGTFGRGLYNTYPADPESPYFVRLDNTSHGFMQYTVTADRIDASFTKIDGTLNDAFSIVTGALAAADRNPPSQPTNLLTDISVPGRVGLTWTGSTDDAAIRDYAVFRDGLYVGTSTTTAFSDPSVTSGLTYTYTVSAYDTAGNPSPPSDPATATLPIATILTFVPEADATIREISPTTNYGTAVALEVDSSSVKHFLIRFTVTGVGTRTVTNAKLRLSCVDNSPKGGDFTLAASNDWIENTVTWPTAPAAGATVATLGQVVAGTTYEINLTSLITGDGTYTLRVTSTNADGADYTSRDGAIGSRPQLIVTTSA